MEISGKTVLLTGASGGIGRAMAQRLADAGARLLLGARDAERLASLAAGLAPGALTVAADIATASGRLALVEAARAAAVDVVIHNAGIQEFGLFDEQDPEALQRQLELNL